MLVFSEVRCKAPLEESANSQEGVFKCFTLIVLQMGSYFGYAVATTDINGDG